ncbi:MAG TPA: hypothetical protein GXX72_06735 [Clostridiaceae bacterium]|nr:hypothetical protein [Clostridiaceae bacterium]
MTPTENSTTENNKLWEKAHRAAALAKAALLFEVNLTPKPGLVDRHNVGSHPDMTIEMFYRSAEVLEPYFAQYWLIGASVPLNKILWSVRRLGLEAEEKMLATTGGRNTHKGAHFSLAMVLATAAYMKIEKEQATSELHRLSLSSKLLSSVPIISGDLIASDLTGMKDQDIKTAGEISFHRHRIGGIRAEVSAGFPTITRYGLNLLEIHAFQKDAVNQGKVDLLEDRKLALDYLMTLLAKADDTTLIKRGGIEGLNYARTRAISYLRNDAQGANWEKALYAMDLDFTNRNLSPGGAADLLTVTKFSLSLWD